MQVCEVHRDGPGKEGVDVFKLGRGAIPLLLAFAVACSDDTASAPLIYTAQFTAANDLIAPITIHVDGVPNVILLSGMSATIAASTRSHVTWTSAKPADAFGHLIPDDIGVNEVPFGSNRVLEITNIINDQPHFTASIYNFTNLVASIGVFDGSAVACVAVLPAASNKPGFVQTGYYRATRLTELRAYQNPSGCTGAYTAWPSSEIGAYAPKTGLIRVSLVSDQ
jgi:hypothetical protein